MTDEDLPDAGDGSTRTLRRPGRDRLREGADRTIEQLDAGVVDLLARLLDTEARARIYVHLRKDPGGTSEEVATGTGLYPSTVREALAEMHEEGIVTRDKRETGGAGNNPYEYTAIAPHELVRGLVSQLQDELNALCNLDRHLDGEDPDDGSGPVRIVVREEGDDPDE